MHYVTMIRVEHNPETGEELPAGRIRYREDIDHGGDLSAALNRMRALVTGENPVFAWVEPFYKDVQNLDSRAYLKVG